MPKSSPERTTLLRHLQPYRGGLWLAGASAVLGLALLPYASYIAALPLIQQEWGLTNVQAGAISVAAQIGYVVAVLLLLPLTDRLDARRMLLFSTALTALANALFPLVARDAVTGIVLRALAGASHAGVYMPGMRLVAERYASAHRGAAVGVYVSAFYLGNSVSLGVTGLLIPPLGWRGAYLAVSLAALSAALVMFILAQGTRPSTAPRATGRLNLAVLANRPALLLILGYVCHSWELFVARVWIGPFLAAVLLARGTPLVEATAIGAATAAVLHGAGVLGTSASGWVSDRLGRSATAAAILAMSALCSLAFGWLFGAPWGLVLVVGLLFGILIAADSPLYSTGVTEVATPGHLGSTMAVQSFAGFLASIPSPVVFGLILDTMGPGLGWGLGFASGGVAAALGVAAMLALRRTPGAAQMAMGRR
ncbi:MAG: MFS transporter [Chloroflexi bacterium]|nr:MFS transporter [Chloroflexota bacterium]